MVDEMFDRQYQAGRKQLNGSLATSFARMRSAIRETFEVLVKIEYQSPWTAKQKRIRCN